MKASTTLRKRGTTNKNYDPEFKQEVLRLVAEGNPIIKSGGG